MSLEEIIIGRIVDRVLDHTMEELLDFDMEDAPTPKSVGGATSIYLKQIQRDFPDFMPNEAMHEIREYVTRHVARQNGTNIVINGIAIAGYRKTENFAVMQYQCSVGFDVAGRRRCETRYGLEYTLRIVDDGVAAVAMKCPNCAAVLEATDVTKCPYCDIKIMRDTILNWEVTSIKEM